MGLPKDIDATRRLTSEDESSIVEGHDVNPNQSTPRLPITDYSRILKDRKELVLPPPSTSDSNSH